MYRPALALLALGLLAGTAAQAAPIPQRVSARPGEPVPLTVETVLRDDCSVRPAPETRIVLGPAHGELAMREGQLRRQDGACPAAPGYVLLYTPDADFNGDDMVTIEITDADKTVVMDFQIMVAGKIAADPADAS